MEINSFYDGFENRAHEYFGAHVQNDGAYFRVYAPYAEKVTVIGEFNYWYDTPLSVEGRGGIFSGFIKNAKPGQMYKYRIYTRDGNRFDKADPYARACEGKEGGASVIVEDATAVYEASATSKACSILKLCGDLDVRKFAGNFSEYARIIKDVAKEYGFTHAEFPVIFPCYFDDKDYPFPVSFFAFGAGDNRKFCRMIEELKSAGLGIIFDFSISNYATDPSGLSWFDGTDLYGDYFGNFDYSKGENKSFIRSAVTYLIETYSPSGVCIIDRSVAGKIERSDEEFQRFEDEFEEELLAYLKETYKELIIYKENDSFTDYSDDFNGIIRAVADERPVRFKSGFKAALGYMEIVKKVNMAYARLSEYEDFKAHMAYAVNDSDYDMKDCEILVSGNKEVELLVTTYDKYAGSESGRSSSSRRQGGSSTTRSKNNTSKTQSTDHAKKENNSFVARNGRFTVDIPAKSGVIYEVK